MAAATPIGVQTSNVFVPDPRRWWALIALALAQLMVVLDGTIMTIALPSAQRDLGMSHTSGQWVITAYALTFGGLLLFSSRVADLMGHKRAMLVGMVGFALASVAGGLAVNPGMLVGSRVVQGVFGSLALPSIVALVSASFPAPPERTRAFGIVAMVLGCASGIGVTSGGVLTEYANWRWCMFVNVPIAIAAGIMAILTLPANRPNKGASLDPLGAILATGGLASIVYGLSQAESGGWVSRGTSGPLALGVLLLVAFVAVEQRIAHPLLPMRLVRQRRRAGAYLAGLSWGISLFVMFYLLTFYLQRIHGLTPVQTGLGFLPYSVAVLTGVRITARLSGRLPIRALLVIGMLLNTTAVALLTQLEPHGSYILNVFPLFVLLGLGTALINPTATSTSTLNAGSDTAVAGATLMALGQIGGSLGVALAASISESEAASFARNHAGLADLANQAAVHGYGQAGLVSMAITLSFAVAVWLVIGPRSVDQVAPQATSAEAGSAAKNYPLGSAQSSATAFE